MNGEEYIDGISKNKLFLRDFILRKCMRLSLQYGAKVFLAVEIEGRPVVYSSEGLSLELHIQRILSYKKINHFCNEDYPKILQTEENRLIKFSLEEERKKKEAEEACEFSFHDSYENSEYQEKYYVERNGLYDRYGRPLSPKSQDKKMRKRLYKKINEINKSIPDSYLPPRIRQILREKKKKKKYDKLTFLNQKRKIFEIKKIYERKSVDFKVSEGGIKSRSHLLDKNRPSESVFYQNKNTSDFSTQENLIEEEKKKIKNDVKSISAAPTNMKPSVLENINNYTNNLNTNYLLYTKYSQNALENYDPSKILSNQEIYKMYSNNNFINYSNYNSTSCLNQESTQLFNFKDDVKTSGNILPNFNLSSQFSPLLSSKYPGIYYTYLKK
jgi:hypothetical protein